MNIHELLKRLNQFHPELLTQNPEFVVVQDVEIYDDSARIPEPGILYIVKNVNFLPAVSDKAKEKCFFCISKNNWTKEKNRIHTAGNIIVLKDPPLPPELYQMLSCILKKHYLHNRNMAALNHMLYEHDTLPQILEKGAALMNGSLVLRNFFADTIYTSDLEEDMEKRPVQFTVKIKSHSMVVGELSIRREQPFRENDFELSSLLGKIIACEIERDSLQRNFASSPETAFIVELLENHPGNHGSVKKHPDIYKWQLKKHLYVLTVAAQDQKSPFILEQMRMQLQNVLLDCKSALYHQQIIFVFARNSDIVFGEEEYSHLHDIFEKKHLYGGISRAFSNLEDLRTFYCQSQKALEFGRRLHKEKNLFCYDDYMFYHMLELCSSRQDITDFCHSDCLELIKYDHSNHTNYSESLFIFLHHNGCCKTAAEKLHVTPAALSYRISKIQDILHSDLNDSEYFFQLLFSFEILYFKHGIKGEAI